MTSKSPIRRAGFAFATWCGSRRSGAPQRFAGNCTGSGGLASRPVSTAVNSVRNNGPSLIEPLGDAEPPGSSLF